MVTLKDIAQKVGVNTSTVSRALNDSPSISEEMREKICQAAQEMGYSLRGRGGREMPEWCAVGLIIPEATSEYYSKLAHLTQDRLAQRGYSCMIQLTNFSSASLLSAIHAMARIRVKCLLIVLDAEETVSDKVMDAIHRSGLPVMLVTSDYLPKIDVDCIHFDENIGMRAGVEHLVQQGYQRIAFLGERMTESRCIAFEQAMEEKGLPTRLVAVGKERGELGGYLRMKELLGMQERPDAVFAGYDLMAIGAIHALHEAGLSVPGDVAVMGFDDCTVARYVEGGITTIANPSEDLVSIAVNILLKRMQAPNRARQQIALRPRLIIRKTT